MKSAISVQTEPLFPTVMPEMGVWPFAKGTCLLGSRNLDRYIAVPEAKLAITLKVIGTLDGRRSLEAISEEFIAQGYKVDVAALCARLRESGLLAGSRPNGELQRFSFALFEVSIAPFVEATRRLATKVSEAQVWTFAIIILAAAFSALWNFRHLFELAKSAIALPKYALFPFVGLGLLGSVLTHEMAHALVAARYGLAPQRIRVIAYFCVIPAFVLRIPGIYLLPAPKRIAVWAAGIVASLGLAGSAALLALHAPLPFMWRQVCAQAAVANLFLSGLNLVPFLPTDGYFIASTLLRQPNMRRRARRELVGWVRHKKVSHPALLVYALISILFVLLIVGRNVFGIYRLAHYSIAGCLLVVFVVAAISLIRLRTLVQGAARPRKE